MIKNVGGKNLCNYFWSYFTKKKKKKKNSLQLPFKFMTNSVFHGAKNVQDLANKTSDDKVMCVVNEIRGMLIN